MSSISLSTEFRLAREYPGKTLRDLALHGFRLEQLEKFEAGEMNEDGNPLIQGAHLLRLEKHLGSALYHFAPDSTRSSRLLHEVYLALAQLSTTPLKLADIATTLQLKTEDLYDVWRGKRALDLEAGKALLGLISRLQNCEFALPAAYGRRISAARKREGLSREELAQAVRTHHSVVEMWETDELYLADDQHAALESVLGPMEKSPAHCNVDLTALLKSQRHLKSRRLQFWISAAKTIRIVRDEGAPQSADCLTCTTGDPIRKSPRIGRPPKIEPPKEPCNWPHMRDCTHQPAESLAILSSDESQRLMVVSEPSGELWAQYLFENLHATDSYTQSLQSFLRDFKPLR